MWFGAERCMRAGLQEGRAAGGQGCRRAGLHEGRAAGRQDCRTAYERLA